ncbi:MAG: type II CRISPR-associated endonuclease Cas1 [Clostridiales bacterium]|nr:type II CRISPR-associated endonuclease Cas1 [Candidatus Crickella merdequi]
MGFRTVEISKACEIHIKDGQLEVTSKDGMTLIPVEDINQIMVHGANIRLSTMDLSILSQNKVAVTTLDEKYLPTAIVLPFEGNSRQSKMMHAQIATDREIYLDLWCRIIKQKIYNQSRALSIMGLDGAEDIIKYAEGVSFDNVNRMEALAAKEYFAYYHAGLNRRTDDPVNSRLNYGYAVVRSAIVRSLVASGFHPTFGIHHDSQLNAFNLADDLIEPYRAMVDVVAHNNVGTNLQLSKVERKAIAHILHNACMVCGAKVNVMASIDIMVESLKRIILDKSSEPLQLPTILPVESMEGITE